MPNTAETMIAAVELLADLNATWEHPGFIDLQKDGVTFAIGDANGDYSIDCYRTTRPEWSEPSGYELTREADALTLANWIRQTVAKLLS